ncbi:Protein of unknown function, partial [Cotesia congregata]
QLNTISGTGDTHNLTGHPQMPPAVDLSTVIIPTTKRKRSGNTFNIPEDRSKISKMLNQQTNRHTIPLSNRFELLVDDSMELNEDNAQTSPTKNQQPTIKQTQNLAAKKEKKPPPIAIHGKVNDHSKITELIKCLVKEKFYIKYHQFHSEIFTTSMVDYTKLVEHLKATNVKFHTYSLKNEKKKTFVIKGLHEVTKPEHVQTELQEIGFDNTQVSLMKGTKYPIFMVAVTANTHLKHRIRHTKPNRSAALPPLRVRPAESNTNAWFNSSMQQNNLNARINQERLNININNNYHVSNEMSEFLELTNQRNSKNTIDNIKICSWNSNGLKNKLGEVIQFLNSYKIDIFLINETRLSDKDKLKIKNYNCIRKDKGHTAGGVAILIRKDLAYKELSIDNSITIECISIKLANEPTHYPTNNSTPTTIDIAIKKKVSQVSDMRVLHELNSDHTPVLLELGSQERNCAQKIAYDYKKADWTNFRKYLDQKTILTSTIKINDELDQTI